MKTYWPFVLLFILLDLAPGGAELLLPAPDDPGADVGSHRLRLEPPGGISPGQVSFGEAVFFGIGAYTAGILVNHLDLSAWWGMALAGPVAVLLALPFGWISFRLRGAYFALVTLALNEVFRHIAMYGRSFTGGMVGILVMPDLQVQDSPTITWPSAHRGPPLRLHQPGDEIALGLLLPLHSRGPGRCGKPGDQHPLL